MEFRGVSNFLGVPPWPYIAYQRANPVDIGILYASTHICYRCATSSEVPSASVHTRSTTCKALSSNPLRPLQRPTNRSQVVATQRIFIPHRQRLHKPWIPPIKTQLPCFYLLGVVVGPMPLVVAKRRRCPLYSSIICCI